MSPPGAARIDVTAIRRRYPIEQVVAASGIQLATRGHGYMGCCPFHDDSTASLSVGGVPGRFHCFGCGAGGDVIDYVQRLERLPFVDAVNWLERRAASTVPQHHAARTTEPRHWTTSAERVYQVNGLAWSYFTQDGRVGHAEAYLQRERGIGVAVLGATVHGEPLVGYADHEWHGLIDHLHGHGVSDAELFDADLGHRSRNGRLIDIHLDRLILPVRQPDGRISGFISRDLTGDPRAPKYRNPTRTPTFDKSTLLYRPTHHVLAPDATVVVVEGPLDALAIAAAAAQLGQSARFAPVTSSGVSVSDIQASEVLALHPRPPVIALDGDDAGAEGTLRWLERLCLRHRQPALVTSLPVGTDPAEWLAVHGPDGLRAFDRSTTLTSAGDEVHPHLPGRQIVQACAREGEDPTHAVITVLVPLALRLPPAAARQLLTAAESEMTKRGWNADLTFTAALTSALAETRHRAATRQAQPEPGARMGRQGVIHTNPFELTAQRS